MTALPLTYRFQSPRQASLGSTPLLLMLHGIGSHEGDLIQLAPYLDPRFAVLSLRAPIPLSMGGFAWFEMTWTEEGPVGNIPQARTSLRLLSSFLDQVLQEGIPDTALDSARIYLMGFSQGAIMSLYLALIQPEKLAGIVAMSGRLPEEVVAEAVEPERMKNLAILAVHGTEDAVLPIPFGREIRDYFTRLPLDFTYREYDMGHEVSPQSLLDIQDWLRGRLN
ncbi:alpha/beta fold hydrolase [Synechococcus sp. Nb3U1]|uniref:alpha/beta hydrolase n=1 Tax=Synechococcus sp. Nb3U1 TaxID=1914529 RepID=UPI001F40BADC|nr:alpha/beta fold hydrolase [Synechococcus sp. Nb3U1]MCF2972097.1 alpha/beta fold hydrolase [Synechococcus sp. Nb3U1]